MAIIVVIIVAVGSAPADNSASNFNAAVQVAILMVLAAPPL